MTAWLDALNDAWDELAQIAPVARQFRTKLISTEVSLDILAGMRAVDNAPCLMLETSAEPDALFELGGMRLSSVPDDAGAFLVLSLEDGNRRDLFATICADVVAAAAQAGRSHALAHFVARLDAWRHFLRDRRDGLSREETIGLVGELMIMEELVAIETRLQTCWAAPADGLHDFLREGHALEVKTSLGPTTRVRISSLDQLETTGLHRLDLVHVRLIEASDGRTLDTLLGDIQTRLSDEASRRDFANALLRRGLMPDDTVARTSLRFKLRAIDAYRVQEDFPRLSRATVPAAVIEAIYQLDRRAIEPFATDSRTAMELFAGRAA
ncbi:MAG: PD-(D/E)XK motif protein [Mesorhizobium sp.]|uniref:PD-(D/E)XK motif protein n=1 Tax=Mesorhizobium sp. TaxID=1871066 RepID=UPI000FE9D20A|nr:PD-(D/E)XK motif protein [Mesorhizobium sp.]RWP10971.1 MAG: PD-(D/E)XK motif protein [Mesorhizobium sp.]